MAGAKTQSTKQRRFKSTILILFCILLVFPGLARSRALPAQKAFSCSSLRSMARIYMAYGGYAKAQPLLIRALQLAEQNHVEDTEVCACAIDLAYLYKEQGKLTDAETTCRLGLELQQKVYREDHPYVAYTLRILSEIYRKQGRYQEAANALERALDIVQRVGRGSEQEVAPFKVDMAHLLIAQGHYAQAESHFIEALSVIETAYGPEHLYTAKVRTGLAMLYALEGRYVEADALVSEALPVQEKIYGRDHHLLVPVCYAIHWEKMFNT